MGGLYKWHAATGEPRSEGSDKTRMGYFVFHQGKWLMVNENLTSLSSPSGKIVPPGQAVELADGAVFRLSQEPKAKMVEVQVVRM